MQALAVAWSVGERVCGRLLAIAPRTSLGAECGWRCTETREAGVGYSVQLILALDDWLACMEQPCRLCDSSGVELSTCPAVRPQLHPSFER